MTKIDPYKSKEKWMNWKARNQCGIPNLSSINSNLVMKYLDDMEKGINVSLLSKKGGRSFIRLNSSRCKLIFLIKSLQDTFKTDNIGNLNEEQLINFFSDMRNGTIRRKDGAVYRSVRDFSKNFKAFWHWYQKISKKAGKEIPDITVYLDSSGQKPDWVYLTETQVRQLCEE